MSTVKDMMGQRFGWVTVLERVGSDKWGLAAWRCKCKCGKVVVILGRDLRLGRTKSCGCLHKTNLRNRIGIKNSSWKGNQAKHAAVHMWLAKNKPRSVLCEKCRERPPTELSFNHKNGEWSRNPEDYEWLCHSCHRLKDEGRGARPLTKARIHRIREFYDVGAANQCELAVLFRVTQTTISNVIRGTGVYQDAL